MRGRPCLPGRGGHQPAPCAPGSKLHITEAAGSATTAQRGRPPSPAARGARFLLIQEKFLLQQDKVPDTEKHSVGARGSRRGPTRTPVPAFSRAGSLGTKAAASGPRCPSSPRRSTPAPPGSRPPKCCPGSDFPPRKVCVASPPSPPKTATTTTKKTGTSGRMREAAELPASGRSFIKVLPLYFPPR